MKTTPQKLAPGQTWEGAHRFKKNVKAVFCAALWYATPESEPRAAPEFCGAGGLFNNNN